MAKGEVSKQKVLTALKEALAAEFVGMDDKKRAVFEFTEDGAPCQVAVALTCPKTMLEREGGAAPAPTTVSPTVVPSAAAAPTEFTAEERANVEKLLSNLGIEF